jgi:hypothetical protein
MSANTGAARLVALIFGLLASAGLISLFMLLKPPPDNIPIGPMTSADCRECHADLYAEWKDSHHAFAYLNPEVRKLSLDFRNEECLACHAPRPVLGFEPGDRVLARSSDRSEGVDCLACHQSPSGIGVATASRNPSNSPCSPYYEPRMSDVGLCASCHNQHKTVDQWHDAPAELKGENCLQCHMPKVFRKGGRQGAAHGFPAAHDYDALLAAIEFKSDVNGENGNPIVSLSNVGAAHNFPTDERSRAADIQVRWQNESGAWMEWERVRRFRDPYRDETDLTNTQLPSGDTWSQTLVPPTLGSKGEARLLYRSNPYLPDEDSIELGRVYMGN